MFVDAIVSQGVSTKEVSANYVNGVIIGISQKCQQANFSGHFAELAGQQFTGKTDPQVRFYDIVQKKILRIRLCLLRAPTGSVRLPLSTCPSLPLYTGDISTYGITERPKV